MHVLFCLAISYANECTFSSRTGSPFWKNNPSPGSKPQEQNTVVGASYSHANMLKFVFFPGLLDSIVECADEHPTEGSRNKTHAPKCLKLHRQQLTRHSPHRRPFDQR